MTTLLPTSSFIRSQRSQFHDENVASAVQNASLTRFIRYLAVKHLMTAYLVNVNRFYFKIYFVGTKQVQKYLLNIL